MFSFGCWGSGAATSQLVEAIDAAERERGFGHPLWVDTRIRRSVRAVGFRDGAFAQLLGPRHVWMPDLGNARVLHGLPGIEIKRPAAALELLDRAIEQPTRRVIFFCACEQPETCHRREVGKLLVRAARSRGIAATVVEWPGDEPREANVEIPHAIFRKIARGVLRTMPLPATMSLGEATAVPWGSRVVLRADGEELGVLVGPPHFNAHGAYLPILPTDGGEPTLIRLDAAGRRYRSKYGYEPMS